MRKLVFGMVGVVALSLAACSSGKPSTTGTGNAGNTGGQATGGGGSGGTGNTGNSGGSGGVGNTGGQGGSGNTGNTGSDCNDWEIGVPDCDACIIDNCCEEASACLDDDICVDCVTGSEDPDCANNGPAADVVECAQAACEAECFPPQQTITPQCNGVSDPPSTAASMGACAANMGDCNPVTQEGCDLAAGEACDFGQDGFTCYPDGNVQSCGDACGVSGSDYCVGGLTCVGSCARFCCTDADCGNGNTCTILDGEAVGVCGTVM